MHRALTLAVGSLFLLASCRDLQSAAGESRDRRLEVSAGCTVSTDDEQWILSSLASWETLQHELMPSQSSPKMIALFFDDDCIYRVDPLTFGQQTLAVSARPHEGRIELPSGGEIPAGTASFAAPYGNDSVFFVMALPSVWRTTGRTFAFDLRSFLTAVMIHEMSHIVQFRTYLRQSAEVEGIELLGENVNDDIVQERFADDESFSQSVQEETQILFAAARAASLTECRSLARRARAMMRMRGTTYYIDELRAMSALEDLFLTLEGSGQFVALAWLTSPTGAGIQSDLARREFGENVRFWSQRQGLALFLVLDRLAPDWKSTVYGDGRRTALALLDDALGP